MRTIGRWVIERRLGAGGMGSVYLAHSPAGLRVAVKVIHPEIAADPEFRRRFRREIQAVRAIGPLYTAPIVDADPDAATPWFAAVYLDGESLHARVERDGPMSEPEVCTLGAGLAEALAAVHAAGVLHRDLKPANVILMPDGPRIIDFGIARMATSNSLTSEYIGTLAYSSPEHFAPTRLGPPSDVYCLGATLHYAATGHSPVGDGTLHQVVGRIIQGDLDLHRLPAALRPIVVPCLLSDPAQRPTASALAERFTVRPARGTAPTATPDEPTAVIRRRPALRRWVPAALVALLAVAGIVWNDRSRPIAGRPVAAVYASRPPRLVIAASARALAFSPDGRTIATGGDRGTVTLWDRATGARRATLDAAGVGIMALAYSPDGRWIAAHGTDDGVTVWDVAAGRVAHRYDGGSNGVGEVGSLGFSRDGRSVAAAEFNGALVHDMTTGRMTDYPVAVDYEAIAAGFVPDGRLLLLVDHTAVTGWRLDRTFAWRKYVDDSTALAIGADGIRFALGDDGGAVSVRATSSGDVLSRVYPRRGPIRSLAYDSQRARVAVGLDNGVAVYSADTSALVASLSGAAGAVLSVAFSPDGAEVAATDPAGGVRVWSAQ